VDTFSSWMWHPRVTVGWAPYSYGRWYWTPVGYSWISYEPWGWYPYHYGSWYLDVSFGWVWGWDSVWSPAWVHWMYTPGYVGWCPRGYYDWWYFHNCHNCWGDRWMHPPTRWNEAAFDFSGRVRLAGVDPRPWTIVPEGQFGNTHLERVRMDPDRFLRSLPGDRTGVVRTGPLVTSVPPRGMTGRGVESWFSLGANQREVPDLSTVLRRETLSGARGANAGSLLRPTLTRDISVGQRVPVTGPTTRGGTGTGSDGWTRGGTTTRSGAVENPSGRSTGRPEVQRGGVTSGTSVQPPVERRPVEHPRTQDTRSTEPRESVKPPSRNVESDRGSKPTSEPPPAQPRQRSDAQSDSFARTRERLWNRVESEQPSAQRPLVQPRQRSDARNDSVARTRERLWNRVETERQALSARSYGTTSRREIPVRSEAAEPRYQPRSFAAPQAVASRESYRAVPVSRAPAAFAQSAPAQRVGSSVSSAPHISSSHTAAPQGSSSHSGTSRGATSHVSAGGGRPH
jgi:hypothetical protein